MYGARVSDVRVSVAEAERGVVSFHYSASALHVWHCIHVGRALNGWEGMKKRPHKGRFDAVVHGVSGHVDAHVCSKKELMERGNSQFS